MMISQLLVEVSPILEIQSVLSGRWVHSLRTVSISQYVKHGPIVRNLGTDSGEN